MKPFAYERAGDAAAAVAAAADGATFLGGGTNLVDLMKLGVAEPLRLVDVSRLPHDAIEETPAGLRIGAAVRNADLAAHPAVRERYPVLSQALLAGASGQLRNLATVGGNLLQRTRCAYFQDTTKPCNKRRPGSGCPAREGEHRNLAILGHSEHCVATHPSDMAVALAAIGATVHVLGADGPRTIPLPGLHRLPGDRPQHDTVLNPGDLITAVELGAPAPRSTYRKVRDRASLRLRRVLRRGRGRADDGDAIREARSRSAAWRTCPGEPSGRRQCCAAREPTPEAFAAAADAELDAAQPLRDNAFKVPLARNVIVRTLAELTA